MHKCKTNNNEIITYVIVLLMQFFTRISWGYLLFYAITLFMLMRIGFHIPISLIKNYYWLFVLPNVIILVHAFTTIFVYHQTFFIMRSINNFMFIFSCIIFTACIFSIHKEKSLKILLNAILTYYLFQMGEALLSVGVGTFLSNVIKPGTEVLTKWLEQHDIGLSLGLIIIYYIYFFKGRKKERKKYLFLSIIVFLYCSKRIAIGGLIAVIVFRFFYRRKIDKRGKLTLLWGLTGVALCLGFVYLVSNESITGWLWNHGINTMGRTNIYRTFRPYYELNPLFYGRGSGFTSKLMSIWVGTDQKLGGILALHSDILRAFIEYGFIGSILWYSYYLIILPRRIAKKNERYSEVVFLIALYAFIVYLTDNTSNYMLFQTFFMLIPLCAEAIQEKNKLTLSLL